MYARKGGHAGAWNTLRSWYLLLLLSDPDFTSPVLFPPASQDKATLSLLLGWAERHLFCLQQTPPILSFPLPFKFRVCFGGWIWGFFVKMVLVEAACLTALLAKICCLSTEQECFVLPKLSYSHHLHAASLLWRSTSRGESILLSLS